MSRLIKSINTQISNFLQKHILYNQTSNNIIDEIIMNYPDCYYSGELYRIIFIYEDDVEGMTEDEIINFAKQEIRITDKYNSCTKNQNSIDKVINFLQDEGDFPIIIKFNGEGLDINDFVEKAYSEKLINESVYNELSQYSYQNEILSIVPNTYEIISVGNK